MARHAPSQSLAPHQPSAWREQVIQGLLTKNTEGRSLFEMRFLAFGGMSSPVPVELVHDIAGAVNRPDIIATHWTGEPGRSRVRVHLVAVSNGSATYADVWRLMAGGFHLAEWVEHTPKVRRALVRLQYEPVFHLIGGSPDDFRRFDLLGFLQETSRFTTYEVAFDPFEGLVIRTRFTHVIREKQLSEPLAELARRLRQQVRQPLVKAESLPIDLQAG